MRSIRSSLILLGLSILLLPGCEPRRAVRPTPQMEVESQFWIRVLLASNVSECTVEIPSAFRVVQADFGLDIESGEPAREPLGGRTRVALVGGRLQLGSMPLADSQVVISPEPPCVFTCNDISYRGKLKLS
ncbi:MAG: hypothetical protein ACM3VT_09815, partial [Solirubrobacterales bacterium]